VGEAAQAAGTRPSAPRRRGLRGTALLTGAALLTGLLQATGAGALTPGSAPSLAAVKSSRNGTGSRTAAVTLNSISPRIPAAGDTITVSGSVVNNSRVTIGPAKIAVHIAGTGPLRSRSAIEAEATRTVFDAAKDGPEINGHTVTMPDLAPGRSEPFTITFPVSALDLGATGVYGIGIGLDGQDSAEPYDHVLGIKRTFVPWYPSGETAKSTRIGYLWPLTDRPHIDPRGDIDSQQSPIFLDDSLAAELKPGDAAGHGGGRLWQLVQTGKQLPITWVVDPDLLATVEAMTKPYRVAGPHGDITRTTAGTGSAVAKQWLNLLKTAVANQQVVALPFGDPDLASLAHNGADDHSNVSLVKTGTALGKTTVDTILGIQATSKVAWPQDGAIDPSIVSVARDGGADTVIARSDSLQERASLVYTPNAARPIGHGTTAAVADAALSTAFEGDMGSKQSANLAVQQYIAQTLLVTMQAPDTQRTILVAPQRMPSAAQAAAMAEAIRQTDAGDWVEPTDLNGVLSAKADPLASRHVPSAHAYPKSLRAQELPADAFRQLHEVQLNLDDFVVILTIKDRVTVPFRNAMLRATSTNWRGDARGEKIYRNTIGRYLTDLIGAVHILSKSDLTLSGRSGTIPVTVKNDLGQPITGLVLRLSSDSNIRLKIKNPQQPIAIDGGHTRTLKFETTASANGPAQITAQLYTQNGALYDKAVDFKVQLTNVTDLVMLIIAAGLLLLVLAGVRIYRQRKRHAAAGGGHGGADGGVADTDGTDPGQPGDPAANTGQESPERSPAGEKVDG